MAKKKSSSALAIGFILLASVLLYAALNYTATKKVVELTGVLKTGEQVGRDYCLEGVYLDRGEYQGLSAIQIRDGSGGIVFDHQFLDTYVGRTVKIKAEYDPDRFYCEALICQCDEYVILREIRIAG